MFKNAVIGHLNFVTLFVLMVEAAIRRPVVVKGWTQSATIIFLYLVAFKWCTVGIPRALKCDKIIFSTILYHHQPELLIHRIDPWLSFFLTLPSNC